MLTRAWNFAIKIKDCEISLILTEKTIKLLEDSGAMINYQEI